MLTCKNKLNECECLDDPVSNYSSENPDAELFCAVVTVTEPPRLGMCDNGGGFSRTEECCSAESQLDAYLCALRQAQERIWATWTTGTCLPPGCPPNCELGCPPPGRVGVEPYDCDPTHPVLPLCPPVCPVGEFFNSPQSCTVDCPDGTHFTYTVPYGTIVALTQVEADYRAHGLACQQAARNKICISTSALPGVCIDSFYSETLHAVGGVPWLVMPSNIGSIPVIQCPGITFGSRFPYVWSIVAGSLPTGLELNPCSGVIEGTTTSHGVFTFTVRATDSIGGHQQKELSICVVEITTAATLPDATIGTAYSQALNQEPGSAPSEKWTLISGTVPAGLSLSESGVISGTPTGPTQSVNLVIQVEVDCA